MLILETRNGPYEYEVGGLRDEIHELIANLSRACEAQLEEMRLNFVYECLPRPIELQKSIEDKLKELQSTVSGLACVAEALCPTLAAVLQGGRNNIGNRMTPVPGFDTVLHKYTRDRISRCNAVLGPLAQCLSKPSLGGFTRQVLSMQKSFWPLSSSATAKVVKQLQECIGQFQVQLLEENILPPLKKPGYIALLQPELGGAEEKIDVVRWALGITPAREVKVQWALLDEIFDAYATTIKATRSLEDSNHMLEWCQRMANSASHENLVSNYAHRGVARAYALRFEISDRVEDIDAAVESQQKIRGHGSASTQQERDSQTLESYRKTAASRKERVEKRRVQSRLHDRQPDL